MTNKLKNFYILIGIFIFFTIIGIFYTWPLILHFNSAIPISLGGGKSFTVSGDPLESYYFFWNFADSLLKGESPFFARYHFATGGPKEAIGFTRFPMTLIYFLLFPFDKIFAYNFLIWLSFPLTGIATYLLLNLYLKSPKSALLGALFGTLIPFRQIQLVSGHLNALVYFLFPLAIYFYELAFEKKQIFWSFCSAITIISLALSAEVHLLLYLIIFAIFHLFLKFYYFLKSRPDKIAFKKWFLIFIVIFLGIFMALAYTFFMKKLVVEVSAIPEGRTLREVRIYSAFITSFFNRRITSAEIYTYLGVLPLLFLIFAFADFKRKNFLWLFALGIGIVFALIFVRISQIDALLAVKHRLRNFTAWSILPISTIIFLWLIGKMVLSKNEDKKILYLLFFMIGVIWSLGTRFPLYKIAFEFVPYLRFFRSPARAMAFVMLGLSFLTAAGYFNLEGMIRKRLLKIAFFSFSMILILFDFKVSKAIGISYLEKNNPVCSFIKENSEPFDKILALPLLTGTLHQNSLYEYYVTLHNRPIINGYHPYPSKSYNDVYLKLRDLNYRGPNKENIQLLKDLKVRYLILHRRNFLEVPVEYLVFDENLRKMKGETLFKNSLEGLRNCSDLKFIQESNGMYLFELKGNK